MIKLVIICMVILYGVLAGASIAGEALVENITLNGNGTVTDNYSHLMWQQCEGGKMTWEEAFTYCEGLSLAGFKDWRFPQHEEMRTLVDFYPKSSKLKYNPKVFPKAVSKYYWTSTQLMANAPNAWVVSFYDGLSNDDYVTASHYVRCVRGGQ